jgi:PleD family two-component response regulator
MCCVDLKNILEMHEMNENASEIFNSVLQKTILLVDDDEDEHEIFQAALKTIGTGFSFISARNCDDALDILKTVVPDVIFIDVNMPRINGMTCLQEIKKISSIIEVPVYMYSTGMNARDGQRALHLGAIDYIIKPNSISALNQLLIKILGVSSPL